MFVSDCQSFEKQKQIAWDFNSVSSWEVQREV